MLTIKTTVKPSKINGVGLFADQLIAKGEVVHRFVDGFDRSLTMAEFEQLPIVTQEYIKHYGYISRKNGHYIINFDDIKFTNHSDTPNIAPDETSLDFEPPVIALRDIQPGEELTEDYRSFAANYLDHFSKP